MEILGDGEVNTIHLKHTGKNANMKCILSPLRNVFDLNQPVDLKGSACITFDDLMEVNEMIEILTRFRSWIETQKWEVEVGVDLANGRDWTSPITEKDKELIKKYFGKKGEDK